MLAPSNRPQAASVRTTTLPHARHLTTKQILGKNPPLPSTSTDSIHYEPRDLERSRLEEYYHAVLAPDLMTMQFHQLTDHDRATQQVRTNDLRSWDGTSPYHKNRPLRPLKGKKIFKPLHHDRNFRNVPKLEEIYVHTMVKESLQDKSLLLSAYMAVNAITAGGPRPEMIDAKKSVAPWKLRQGQSVGLKVKLQGAPMYAFLATLVEIVLPQLKDFTGLSATTGDTTGNIAFGLPPSAMARFPEIEANYEQYPHLPGLHVIVNTSATNDADAKQLLSGYGLPFKR